VASTVPETLDSLDSRVTPGERRVFVALRDHLPEDYLVYYDIPVDGRHPDFIIVGPDLGLVVLEVKDWRLKSILEVTADRIRLRQAKGELDLGNPVRQVRDYLLRTVDALKKRPRLCADNQLGCGWGAGVVLPYVTPGEIRQPSLVGPSLEEALGPGLVLTGADLAAETLLPRLRKLIPARGAARGSLDAEQVDEIRSVLHPEIRIGWGATGEEIVRVMDLEQERLARTLGDGHRLLRGVAGSGKTIVLICRVRHLLAQHPDWRILVVCYNRVLAGFLHRTIGDKRVEVSTFDAWCRQQLRAANVDVPEPPGRGQQWDDFWVETVPKLLSQAFDEGRVPTGAYQAILVDEGQDFADTWYRVLLRALDPEANRLFIALDSSQNIYRRRISWRSLGIQIAGFPNLFTITGPGSPSVLMNMPVAIEYHVNWVADCIEHMRKTGRSRIEATAAAQAAWGEHVAEVGAMSLFGKANSWYVGANIPGKPRVVMPYAGGQPLYRERVEAVTSAGYEGFEVSG